MKTIVSAAKAEKTINVNHMFLVRHLQAQPPDTQITSMRALLRPLFLVVASCLCFLAASAQTVRVLTVSGEATIQPADGSPARPITVGDTITLGTRIVTAANGRVIITPFPGIKSIISPSSDITIEKISETKASGSNVALQQAVLNLKSGAVVSGLEKQEGVAYDYAIRTPRGVAGARGTTYTVAVAPSGVESVIVTDGRIQITLTSGATYNLAPGQASVSRPGAQETAISNVSELPADDQKTLKTTLESSLGEIAKAIESGIDLKPATLKNTLEFAGKVGLEIDPKLIQSIKAALEKEQATRTLEEKPKAKAGDRLEENKNNQTPENKEAKEVVREQVDPILTAYLAELSPAQRATFLALPAAARLQLLAYYQSTPLALRGEFARSPFAIQTLLISRDQDSELRTFALTPASDGNSRSLPEITYFLGLSTNARPSFLALTLVNQRATVAYFDQLPAGLRAAFISASPSIQAALLANFDNTALAQFALTAATDGAARNLIEIDYFRALPVPNRTAFLALPLAEQRSIATYFDRLPVGLRAAFAGNSIDVQKILLNASTDSDLANFALTPIAERTYPSAPEVSLYNSLATNAIRAAYLLRPIEIRNALVQIGDADLAIFALSADRNTGILMTNNDLLDALTSLKSLNLAALTLFKDFAGGPGLPSVNNAPSPTRFSPAAFARTLNSWNALTNEQRSTFLRLGAGEAIMDTSATYLSAIATSFDQQPLLLQTTMTQTGWGPYLTEILANEDLRNVLTETSTLSASQQALIKEFQLGPYAFAYNSSISPPITGGGGNVNSSEPTLNTNPNIAYLNALAALSPSDRAILKRLGLQDALLYPSRLTEYPILLEETLSFYQQLTPSQREFLVATEAGNWIWSYGPTDNVNGPLTLAVNPLPAIAYVSSLIESLSTLSPVEKDALRDIQLLSGMQLNDSRLTPANVRQILSSYLGAPDSIKPLLRGQIRGRTWFDMILSQTVESNARPLADVVAILSALTPAEISDLRDMQIGDTLAYRNFFQADNNPLAPVTAIQQLKAMIGVYRNLGDLEKFTLRELGIVKTHESNFAAFLADPQGLAHLLKAYAALPGALRAETQQIEPNLYDKSFQGRSFFVPRTSAHNSGSMLYNVSFTSNDDLYIGAPRILRIQNGGFTINDTFTTGTGKSLYLRAGDLVQLTDTTFSTSIRSIVIEAATIHLQNIDFNDGSTIALNSKFGGANALGTGTGPYPIFLNYGDNATFGRVNFDNVRYNGNSLHDASAYDAYGVNIKIGTLDNPAAPATTPISVPSSRD